MIELLTQKLCILVELFSQLSEPMGPSTCSNESVYIDCPYKENARQDRPRICLNKQLTFYSRCERSTPTQVSAFSGSTFRFQSISASSPYLAFNHSFVFLK